jgi:hypothetical protein
MEKLAAAGLVEMQPTRPKLYAALPADVVVDRLVELMRQDARRFEAETEKLRPLLASVPDRLKTRQTFVDVAPGAESHVKRHVTHLAAANRRILSYLERSDLGALDQAVAAGFPILRRIGRNAVTKGIDHRVVFGFSYQTAPRLIEFLRVHEADPRDALNPAAPNPRLSEVLAGSRLRDARLAPDHHLHPIPVIQL